MFYIHFWTKLGQLERVPYPTAEEALQAAWFWEIEENKRLGTSDGLPGAIRDKMITVITDEDNEICPTETWGIGFTFEIKHHPDIFLNEHHWAAQFEAASRRWSPETVECGCDVFCRRNEPYVRSPMIRNPVLTEVLIRDNAPIAVRITVDPAPEPVMPRDERIMHYYSNGTSRKAIAELLGLSYATVCRVIRDVIHEPTEPIKELT